MNVKCPRCAATGTISEALVPDGGKTVACPKCRVKFTVTKAPSKAGPDPISSPLPPEEKVPVTCRACGASGSLPASRIPPGGATITCPKCKARFPVNRPVPAAAAITPATSSAGGTVPYRCPQCGREGSVSGRLVPEGGTGMNCPGCNTRFFVRRPGEADRDTPATPQPRAMPARNAADPTISSNPGLVGASVTVPRPLTPSGLPRLGNARADTGPSLDEMWGPSVGRAVAGGAAAALVGAMIWAFITVITSFQIGWMAIGVGALVGFAVKFFGRSTDQTFGFIGAGFSLFGCAVGNLMAACAFISSDPRNAGFISILFDALGSPGTAARIMGASFHPLDILFYIFAVSTGYKVALSNE
jgi:predicted Zn finger-like uncharacterized protein